MKVVAVTLMLAVALAASLAFAPLAYSADASMVASAVSGKDVRLNGTMAPEGSFEWKAAPTYTGLFAYRDWQTDRAMSGLIKVETLQASLVRADEVRALLDNALRACAQDNHTGACTKDGKTAEKLLAQAASKLKKLKKAAEVPGAR